LKALAITSTPTARSTTLRPPVTVHRLPITISRLDPRTAVLVDLSPAATFITYNHNTAVDMPAFEAEAQRILAEVEAACG
jgi:hypothetical protein